MRRAWLVVAGTVVVAVVAATVVLTGGDDASQKPRGAAPATKGAPDASPVDDRSVPVPMEAYLRRACELPTKWVRYIRRGWNPGDARDDDLVIVPKPPSYMGTVTNTSHSAPYDFLQRVPLVLYGPGFIKEVGPVTLEREVTVADIAPTLGRLMDFEFDTPSSRPLGEVFVDTRRRPKMIFVGVIDGGGWNVLNEWPESWPTIARLMRDGASIEDAVLGSSPSITPAIHTSISTGTFPRFHGVTAIAVRAENGAIVGAFSKEAGGNSPHKIAPRTTLRAPTINEIWDRAVDNEARIGALMPGNYPLGMLGRGSAFPGGDKDIMAGYDSSHRRWATSREFYRLPDYVNTDVAGPQRDIERVDRSDGKDDGLWRGHEIAPLSATPAYPPWQTRVAHALFEREGFGRDEITDLFSVNYKSPDAGGHEWNMTQLEQGDIIQSVDTAIGDTIEWLDRNVGRENYVMVITADHGQTPLGEGGWAISRQEIVGDLNERFDAIDNGEGILERTSASSFFMDAAEMRRNGVSAEDVASFLDRYTIGENIDEGDEVRRGFEDRLEERIFDAVFPGGKIPKVVRCTGAFG